MPTAKQKIWIAIFVVTAGVVLLIVNGIWIKQDVLYAIGGMLALFGAARLFNWY